MIRCIFLYEQRSDDIVAALAALQTFELDIWEVEATPDIVSNLVPRVLRGGTASWLIFFESNRQQDLLILPFPDTDHLQRSSARNFRGYLSDLIPAVNEYFAPTRIHNNVHTPLSWIKRFQYLRHDSSLESLLSAPHRLGARPEVQRTLLETSRRIQQQRSEVLRKALSGQNLDVINELDKVFVEENDELFNYLQTLGGSVEVVPPIVDTFSDIIDAETRRFLITSATVEKFVNDNSPVHFDYAAPGCGLWKAVERELNLSLGLLVRSERGVAEIRAPWRGVRSRRQSILIQTGPRNHHVVNLNEREQQDGDQLSALMLGPVTYMLRWGYTNGVKTYLENLDLTDEMFGYILGPDDRARHPSPLTRGMLRWDLEEIRKLRNGHAHTSVMDSDKFTQLRDLVLPSQGNPKTCLVRILELKRVVHGYPP